MGGIIKTITVTQAQGLPRFKRIVVTSGGYADIVINNDTEGRITPNSQKPYIDLEDKITTFVTIEQFYLDTVGRTFAVSFTGNVQSVTPQFADGSSTSGVLINFKSGEPGFSFSLPAAFRRVEYGRRLLFQIRFPLMDTTFDMTLEYYNI